MPNFCLPENLCTAATSVFFFGYTLKGFYIYVNGGQPALEASLISAKFWVPDGTFWIFGVSTTIFLIVLLAVLSWVAEGTADAFCWSVNRICCFCCLTADEREQDLRQLPVTISSSSSSSSSSRGKGGGGARAPLLPLTRADAMADNDDGEDPRARRRAVLIPLDDWKDEEEEGGDGGDDGKPPVDAQPPYTTEHRGPRAGNRTAYAT